MGALHSVWYGLRLFDVVSHSTELAYGNSPRGQHIKAGDVLVFTIEIIKILGGKVPVTEL
jgi:hypothetical protein